MAWLIHTNPILVVLTAAFVPGGAPHAAPFGLSRTRSLPRSALGGLRAAAAAPEIITFSEKAMSQITGLREKQGLDIVYLRMGVRAGGCSGMSYVMDFMKEGEAPVEEDTVLDFADGSVRCVIDPKSLMFLFGLRLDYSDELIGGGFSFLNPNAEETCGCGKSFGV